MDDITPRVEPTSSFREPDMELPGSGKQRQKARAKAASAQGNSSEPMIDLDDSEKHELDTMA